MICAPKNSHLHFGLRYQDVLLQGFNLPIVKKLFPPINHFQCYEVDHQPFAQGGIELDDAFGFRVVDVGRLKRFCNPADKNEEEMDRWKGLSAVTKWTPIENLVEQVEAAARARPSPLTEIERAYR